MYGRFRDTALNLITKYGMDATLTLKTTAPDPLHKWKSVETETVMPIKCVIFDDDGVLFVNHNITGHTRILMVAPNPLLTDINIGDTVKLLTDEVVTVKKFKQINPNLEGVILWALLIV